MAVYLQIYIIFVQESPGSGIYLINSAMRKILHNLLKGASLTTALFIFQACYGVPQPALYAEEGVAPMSFSLVSRDTGEPLKGILIKGSSISPDYYSDLGVTGEDGRCSVSIPYNRNMEGPFLSPAKSGAQDPQALILPDREVLERLDASGDGHVVAMTVAPELKGIEKITDEAKKQGIILLMGHTNATYEEALKGKALGINHTTHMFNAISKMDHKAPGAVGAVLFDPNMNCEVIADGVHVHKDLVCYLIGTKGCDHVVLITDSLRPTSLGPGKYVINGDNVVLGELGAFVLEKDHNKLCGSALTLNKAVKNVASWTGDVASAVKMASENPASLYGFSDIGSIAKGKLADLAIFDDSFNATEVFVGGKLVYSK